MACFLRGLGRWDLGFVLVIFLVRNGGWLDLVLAPVVCLYGGLVWLRLVLTRIICLGGRGIVITIISGCSRRFSRRAGIGRRQDAAAGL